MLHGVGMVEQQCQIVMEVLQRQYHGNQEAGFSIVTWTGTGSGSTVGHGLGKATLDYIKKRDTIHKRIEAFSIEVYPQINW